METPVLIINLKTYESGTGKRALELARAAERIAKQSGASIALAVQPADIHKISQAVSIPVLAQHVDPIGFGSHTGHILPECVKENGAVGTLINHSERRVGLEVIEKTIKRCQEAGLETIVCAESVEEAKQILKFNPDFVALEDPELIGTLKSISRLRPENVLKFSSLLADTGIKPLCGAGVSSPEDVRAALELGTRGVLLASAITKAKNPIRALEDIAKGLEIDFLTRQTKNIHAGIS